MMKDKSSIEIETSCALAPRPYIVDITSMPYRTRAKKNMTYYIMKYSDGSIHSFKKEEGETDRLDDEDYERKIMKAVTDVKGLSNLRNIYIELGGRSDIENMSNYDLKRAIVELYKSLNNF